MTKIIDNKQLKEVAEEVKMKLMRVIEAIN
jgi:hypothetical protein